MNIFSSSRALIEHLLAAIVEAEGKKQEKITHSYILVLQDKTLSG